MRRFRARQGFLRGLLVAALITMAVAIAPGDAAARPNVVLIQTDDQRLDSLSRRTMPSVHRLLERPGTAFSSYYTSTPLCCPSRAALITGQYGHNNGVLRNTYGDLRRKGSVLPVWLSRAGYRTAHVGKFMNNYPIPAGAAPGWDDWASVDVNKYYDYTMAIGSRLVRFGTQPKDYLGRVVTQRTVSEIKTLSRRSSPFFVQADFPAPHSAPLDPHGDCDGSAVPDPRDEGLFSDEPLPTPPSFNEADTTDKPGFLAARGPLSSTRRAEITQDHRCMLAALRSADRGVARIVSALRQHGELDDTVVVFISDNGVFEGEHRIRNGKHFPYEEAAHLPLLIRMPPRLREDAPSMISSPAANIDLAPTILDLANAEPCVARNGCRTMDGLSLLPQLEGEPAPDARDLLTELDDPNPLGLGKPCRYEAIHRPNDVYVEYSMAEVTTSCEPVDDAELYDLPSDPFQLQNLLPASNPSVEARRESLADRLDELRQCAGVEGRDPRTHGRPYCATD
jgi:N-acetylglucosamine-6-sulfatase